MGKVWLALDQDECEALLALIRAAVRKAPDERLRSIRHRLQADLEQARRQEERIAA